MQKLRAILTTALSRQALCVRLVPGASPQMVFQGQTAEQDQENLLTAAEIEQIFGLIMPGQSFQDQSPITGSLNVGAQGILKLRAFNSPLRIDIFTPAGTTLFDQLLAPLSSGDERAVTPPNESASVSSPLPPPLVVKIPPPQMASPAEGSETVAPAEAPPIVSPVSSGMQAAPFRSVAPPPVEPVAEPVNVAKDNQAKVVESGGPQKSSPVAPVADAGSMFKKSSSPKKSDNSAAKPKASVEKIASVKAPEAAPIAQVPVSVGPVAARQEKQADAPVEEINFGSREAAEGSISRGQNPIDVLLREMVSMKASDLHLTVGQPVVFRVHGDISRVSQDPITPDMMRQLILPTMPRRNHDEFSRIQDTDFAYELEGVGRFRVNVFRDRNGVGAVMRHIPSQILTAEQLGLSPAITKLCTLNKGLVLVTGPTGSGKSTTLAAMIDLINRTRKEHILTIEDPIEFVHTQQMCLVNQREVHKHTGSFARALKAALREDPDIVLIGEMRDLETIAIAIETAETGHLVFGTLHTTTAMSTVDRMIDQFPADRQAQIRVMLSSSLRGVVAQTLLKKKSGGRVAAHEVLIANDAVGAMIREGKVQHLANHMLTQKQDGNQLLNDALLKLVQDGVVDAQDAFFKAVDKNSFLMMAKQRGINITVNGAAA